MAKIQLSSEEIKELSRQMKNWAMELETNFHDIRNLVQHMDGWKDGQYQLFLQNIIMTGKHLQQYFDNMKEVARSLEIYSNNQSEMNSNFNRDLNSIR